MIQALLELVRERRRTLIALAAVLLLNVGLSVWNGTYLVPAITAAQGTWNGLRQRVASAGRIDVASVYQQGTGDLKVIAGRIPPRRQFPRVLGDLLESAAACGVTTGMVTYKPQTVKGHEDQLVYSLAMSVSGGYAAVKSFLGDIQRSGDLIVIDGISLSNQDLYEENVTLDVQVSIYLQAGGRQ